MDEIQKQIIGYLIMAVLGAVLAYVGGKLTLFFSDPTLAVMLGFILTALETAAYKWIRYTFKLPEEEEVSEPDLPVE